MSVKIKICGITRSKDAFAAIDGGADYLGFILHPASPRFIEPDRIQELVQEIKASRPTPKLVGVFVNEDPTSISHILDTCQLDYAQLSGDEPPELISDPFSLLYGRSFKGIQPADIEEAAADAERFLPPTPEKDQPKLLVDAFHEKLRGGTGKTGDWNLAAEICSKYSGVMLAGGLNSINVAKAISIVQPFAVDVSSGVEESPGIKSSEKIHDFIQAVRESSRPSSTGNTALEHD